MCGKVEWPIKSFSLSFRCVGSLAGWLAGAWRKKLFTYRRCWAAGGWELPIGVSGNRGHAAHPQPTLLCQSVGQLCWLLGAWPNLH